MKPFYFYLGSIQDIMFIVSGFVAFFVLFKYGIKAEMRFVFWYNVLGILTAVGSLCKNWFKIIEADKLMQFYYVASVFHYSLICIFIISIKRPLMKVNIIHVYGVLGILTSIVLAIFTFSHSPLLLILINNSSLFILCCFYFNKLFSSTEIIFLQKEPSVWVVSGVLICMCVSLPFSAYSFFLFSGETADFTFQKSVYSVGTLGYTILHVFLIKAYLCLITQGKR
jgi:hypothetical protein